LGRPDDIKDAKQAILNIANNDTQFRYNLSIDGDGFQYFVKERKADLYAICDQKNVKSYITSSMITLIGADEQVVLSLVPEVRAFVEDVKANLVTEVIYNRHEI
jgi:hypothetical protein